jgi:hypothetical protein
MVTLIPGWCGVAVCAVGAFGAESRLIPIALGSTLAGAGCFVAVSGFRRRVVAVEVGSDGIAVRHRSGDPFRTRWAEIDELRSPRWPMGGWTIVAGGRRCTLMPSDLWGKEAMLELVAEAAGYLTMN